MKAMSYRQLEDAIKNGSAVAPYEKKYWKGSFWSNVYKVKVDGEKYMLSTASWNKMKSVFDLRAISTKRGPKLCVVYYEAR